MAIASTSPAPSPSSPKSRLSSSPRWGGPNPSARITPEGRGRFIRLPPSSPPEVRTGDVPWPPYHPSHQRWWEERRFPGAPQGRPPAPLQPHAPAEHHSSASRNTCPKFPSLVHALLSPVQALPLPEEPLTSCKPISAPPVVAGAPRTLCPEPWDAGPGW